MIKIAICDDSEEFSSILEFKIGKCINELLGAEYEIIRFHSLSKLQAFLDANTVDILFLDIMVNDTNSMDWSLSNIKGNYTQIIFMTSYPQCAYNLSEAKCCYYIMKAKMTDETLAQALKKALQKSTKKDPNLTIIKSGSKNSIINFQDIIYLETFNNNLMLHVKNLGNILIYSSLKEYQKTLPPNFLRCHKSFTVNMNHITSYEPYKFITASGSEIPIPPKKYNSVINIYKNYLKNL